MTRIEAKANLALGFSIVAVFASVIACAFTGAMWIRMDINERNGTEPVIIVRENISTSE